MGFVIVDFQVYYVAGFGKAVGRILRCLGHLPT